MLTAIWERFINANYGPLIYPRAWADLCTSCEHERWPRFLLCSIVILIFIIVIVIVTSYKLGLKNGTLMSISPSLPSLSLSPLYSSLPQERCASWWFVARATSDPKHAWRLKRVVIVWGSWPFGGSQHLWGLKLFPGEDGLPGKDQSFLIYLTKMTNFFHAVYLRRIFYHFCLSKSFFFQIPTPFTFNYEPQFLQSIH